MTGDRPGAPRPADAVTDARFRFRLGAFPGYPKGRGLLWQAAWIAVLELLFKRWWLPRRLRPALLRAFGASVGERVVIRDHVHAFWPWFLEIGDDVWIGREAQLVTGTGIRIGHDVCISQQSMIITSGHDPRTDDFAVYDHPVRIGDHVWLGARTVLLHGARVPDHTVVNANAVVHFGQRFPRRDPDRP